MFDKALFAHRMQSARENKGINQKELADILGVSRQQISNYETGKQMPPYETLAMISEKLGVSTDWLIGTKRFIHGVENGADLYYLFVALDIALGRNSSAGLEVTATDTISGGSVFQVSISTIYECASTEVKEYPVFKAWADTEKMVSLLREESIDDEMFMTWKEKTLEKLREIKFA